jgi:hypothetical protein
MEENMFNGFDKSTNKFFINITANNKYKKDHYSQIKEPLKNWLNSKDINIYYLLTEQDLFYRSGLKDSISKTFQQLANIYILMKSCLDENNMGRNDIKDENQLDKDQKIKLLEDIIYG